MVVYFTFSIAYRDKVVSRKPRPELKLNMKKQMSNTLGTFSNCKKEFSEGSAAV